MIYDLRLTMNLAACRVRQLFSLSLGERAGVRASRKSPARLLALLTFSLSHLLTFSAHSADFQVTGYVTITNTPAGLPTNIVFNLGTVDTRSFTNGVITPSTSIQITNSTAATRTNLVSHLVAYPVYSVGVGSPQLVVNPSTTNTSVIEFSAPVNTNLSITFGGNWARVYYITSTYNTAVPIQNLTNAISASARTNAANAIVNYLGGTVPSNSIPPANYAFRHYTDNTSSQTLSNKTFTAPVLNGGRLVNATNLTGTNVAITNVTLHIANITGAQLSGILAALTNGTAYNLNLVNATNRGIIGAITNGLWTNGTLIGAKSTNFFNYGPIASRYNAMGGQAFGEDSEASGINSTALGRGAISSGVESTAGGYFSQATNSSATAYGNQSIAGGSGSSVFGYNSVVSGQSSGGFGAGGNVSGASSYSFGTGNTVTHDNTTVVGNSITSADSNLVQIGSSSQRITLAGPVTDSTLTNTTLKGLATVNGRLDFTPGANTGLANGYNSDTSLGTNVYVKLSGHTGAATNAGFRAATSGTYHIVQVDNPSLNYAVLDNSGLDTVANRIFLGDATTKHSTNNPVIMQIIYDAGVSRWRLVSFR